MQNAILDMNETIASPLLAQSQTGTKISPSITLLDSATDKTFAYGSNSALSKTQQTENSALEMEQLFSLDGTSTKLSLEIFPVFFFFGYVRMSKIVHFNYKQQIRPHV